MNPNREKTIKMIESTGMMPVVREIAERFGNEGRLPSVAIRQGNDWLLQEFGQPKLPS